MTIEREVKNMSMQELSEKKKQEINTMVTVLQQLDLTGIQILTMNANTLLALKMELAKQKENFTDCNSDERKLA
jgi:hypothetical protein